MNSHAAVATHPRTRQRFSIVLVLAMLAALLMSVNAAPAAKAASCPGSWAPTGATITQLTVNGDVVCEIRFTTVTVSPNPGPTEWTVPTGVSSFDAVVVQGGQDGASGSPPGGNGGHPGGRGGAVVEVTISASAGQTIDITVGDAGPNGSTISVSEIARGGASLAKASGGNSAGAGGMGWDPPSTPAQDGGSGIAPRAGLFAAGFTESFGGGGGGGGSSGQITNSGGSGQGGGGDGGGSPAGLDGLPGTPNTGGGGGGGADGGPDPNDPQGQGGAGGSGVVIIRFLAPAPLAALTPVFDTPVSTADGFTVNVTNYDSAYTWAESVDAGSVSAGTASGSTLPLTVTGLSAGASATITVTTTRTGYNSGSATVTGQATAAPGPNPGPNPPAPGPNPGPAPNPAPGPVTPAEPATPGGSSGSGASANGAASTPVTVPTATSPGGAVVLVGGQPAAVTVEPLAGGNAPAAGGSAASTLPSGLEQELPATNGSQLTVGESTIAVTGPQVGGSLDSSSLAIAPGAPVDLALSGFQAGTEVGIFVISADGTAVLVGTAIVGADGVVRSVITVNTDAASGAGRLQIQGTNSSGASLAVALDTEILAPVSPVPTSSGALPEVRPGGSVVLDSQGEPLRATVEQIDGTDIRIRTQRSTSNIQAVDSGGVRPLGAQGAIEVSESGFVRVGGSGFQPGSTVQVWMFSDPSFVGVVKADAAGNYVSLLQLPDSLKPGAHTLQSAGTARNGVKIAASAGLRVTSADAATGTSGEVGKRDRAAATVYFDRMSSRLDAADKKRLDALAAKVGNRTSNVTVTGYVQASSDSSNDKSLSTARARAVAQYLRAQGVRGKYTVTGEGVLNRSADQARSARVVVTYTR